MIKTWGHELGLRRSNFFYFLVRSLGNLLFRILYQLNIEGRENVPPGGPGIILPKHQFWIDIPIACIALWRPVSYIAKQELFVYPGVRQFLTLMGGVPIDRLKPVKSLDSFRYVEQLLQKGDFIVLFPEGTYYPYTMGRGKHRFIQRLLSFQGKMKWQEKNPIPFIPVGIQYVERIFRSVVNVRIGKPLFAKDEIEPPEFTERIMGEIAKLSGLHPREGKPEPQEMT
jgi:1-acyl-sn-glycerol-3-phosphate acyltransferase